MSADALQAIASAGLHPLQGHQPKTHSEWQAAHCCRGGSLTSWRDLDRWALTLERPPRPHQPQAGQPCEHCQRRQVFVGHLRPSIPRSHPRVLASVADPPLSFVYLLPCAPRRSLPPVLNAAAGLQLHVLPCSEEASLQVSLAGRQGVKQ